jgi:hypothetical protein
MSISVINDTQYELGILKVAFQIAPLSSPKDVLLYSCALILSQTLKEHHRQLIRCRFETKFPDTQIRLAFVILAAFAAIPNPLSEWECKDTSFSLPCKF